MMKAILFFSLWLVGYGRWHRQWLRQEKRTRRREIGWDELSKKTNKKNEQRENNLNFFVEWRRLIKSLKWNKGMDCFLLCEWGPKEPTAPRQAKKDKSNKTINFHCEKESNEWVDLICFCLSRRGWLFFFELVGYRPEASLRTTTPLQSIKLIDFRFGLFGCSLFAPAKTGQPLINQLLNKFVFLVH